MKPFLINVDLRFTKLHYVCSTIIVLSPLSLLESKYGVYELCDIFCQKHLDRHMPEM